MVATVITLITRTVFYQLLYAIDCNNYSYGCKKYDLIAKLQKLQLNYSIGCNSYSIGCNDYYIDCKKHLRILIFSIGCNSYSISCNDYYIDRNPMKKYMKNCSKKLTTFHFPSKIDIKTMFLYLQMGRKLNFETKVLICEDLKQGLS
ncbi:hypothetical protein A0H76_1567 [Hepatospora eriocheir]|uniref:Uncharacterized protein n=1 Tax=Hepatospora eriocheir TaxID=1081669 RepID=A0A1X0QGV0_9MICR|nr:hypothetical protein A0H76_1567 [Hepatospora eriocheir]